MALMVTQRRVGTFMVMYSFAFDYSVLITSSLLEVLAILLMQRHVGPDLAAVESVNVIDTYNRDLR
jgi:hypothetical protein